MKYTLYIDYRASYSPRFVEYRALNAKTISDAIIEADAIHNQETMYLIRIMGKSGKAKKVESDVKAQVYTAIMEKALHEVGTSRGESHRKPFHVEVRRLV
jgi:hypothetical protein